MRRLITGHIANPLAESFENLGTLNDTGIFEIKPFKDWVGFPLWNNKIFSMRLCNAGEVLDIASIIAEKPEQERLELTKFEMLSRSIMSIEGRALINEEELVKYNEANKTNFESPREWISIYLRNLEAVVLNRLDAVYGALTLKQTRGLLNNVICGATNRLFTKDAIPEGSLYLKYDLAEILTPEGIKMYPDTYKEKFEIVSAQTTEPAKTTESEAVEKIEDTPKKEGDDTFEKRKIALEEADTEDQSSGI